MAEGIRDLTGYDERRVVGKPSFIWLWKCCASSVTGCNADW